MTKVKCNAVGCNFNNQDGTCGSEEITLKITEFADDHYSEKGVCCFTDTVYHW